MTGNYPNGFPIDTENQVTDAWHLPYQFGDPQEQMLAKVLTNAGYIEAAGTKAVILLPQSNRSAEPSDNQ